MTKALAREASGASSGRASLAWARTAFPPGMVVRETGAGRTPKRTVCKIAAKVGRARVASSGVIVVVKMVAFGPFSPGRSTRVIDCSSCPIWLIQV